MNKSINLEFYKLIFENSLDAIFLTSPDGKIYRANKAACEMFDMSEPEIIRGGRKCIVDTKDPRLKIALNQREATGKVVVELTCLRKGKKPFPGLVSSVVFLDSNHNKWTAIIVRDLTEFKESQKSLVKCRDDNEYLATHDYMTEILNRRGFINKAKEFLENLLSEDDNCAFLLLDIDYFKEVNDNFGHIKGDNILNEFARFLSLNVDNDTLLGRYGGDEFIILLNNKTDEEIIEEANRIKNIIYKKEFFLDNDLVKLSVSIGIAKCRFDGTKDIDEIISLADTNMYKAKIKRNSIHW